MKAKVCEAASREEAERLIRAMLRGIIDEEEEELMFMDFGDVIKAAREAIEEGHDSPRFARVTWKEGESVQVLRKCGFEYGPGDLDIPYMVRYLPDGKRVPWTPTHIDMLAGNWYEVGE